MPEQRAFHEDLHRDHDLKVSSERGFGLTVGGVLLVIGAARAIFDTLAWIEVSLIIGGLLLVTLAFTAPRLLTPLNRAWIKLGLLFFKALNPLVLAVVFVTTVIPTGLIMRLFKHDPLRLKFEPEEKSYWIERKPPGPAPDTMRNQY